MLKGFKDFLLRGNVVELAVAVAVGTAFTALVDQFGRSFIKPLVGVAGGGGVSGGTFRVRQQVFDWGGFINAAIFFVITTATIYFVVVLPMQRIQARRKRDEEAGPTEPTGPTDVELLTEIRDLLRQQSHR
jgi:large conductance mechanosensitive channel